MSAASPSMKPARFILLRHGQTLMSLNKQYSGYDSDPSLTDIGRLQAGRAADYIVKNWYYDLDAIAFSPSARVVETSNIVESLVYGYTEKHLVPSPLKALRPFMQPQLQEINFGAWEGLTFSEAHKRDPDLHTSWLTNPRVAPPHGESIEAVDTRVREMMKKLIGKYEGKTVLIVSHATPIKSILRMALGCGYEVFYRMNVDLGSISVVDFYADGPCSINMVNYVPQP